MTGTRHSKVSGKSDGGDTSLVRPSDWNAPHVGSPYPLDRYTIDGTYGDDFTAASLSGSWTRRNYVSGAETYQVGIDATYLRIDTTGRANGDGYLRAAPSGDWTFATKYITRFMGTNTQNLGLVVVDTNGTGINAFFYAGAPASLIVTDLTTYTSYGGNYTQPGGSGVSPNKAIFEAPFRLMLERPVWISLRKSGTSYFGAYSFDGEVWSPESPGRTWTGTVDRVGLLHGTLGNVGGSATPSVTPIDIDWFNKIA